LTAIMIGSHRRSAEPSGPTEKLTLTDARRMPSGTGIHGASRTPKRAPPATTGALLNHEAQTT
jgi:hypothetical protein